MLESYIPNMAKIFQQRREKLGYNREEEEKKKEEKLNSFWQKIKDKAVGRGDKDCSICVNILEITFSTPW